MADTQLDAVTGATGFTGKYITRLLLARGGRVLSLTGHPKRPNPFGDRVKMAPFSFDRPDELARSLQGVTTLFNTYWIRFSYGELTFERAVANTRTLIRAAEEAGVRRLVHVSITNASTDSPLPYFRGKGLLEKAIAGSSLSHAILRPALIFGSESILINNITWFLRRFPVFAIPGSGQYRLRPIFVEDLAELAVDAAQREGNEAIDAVGPETYKFDDLVRLLAAKVHSGARIVHVNPTIALLFSGLVGRFVGDVVLTRDEIEGLKANLLVTEGPPTGKTRFSDWLDRNAASVGVRYMTEVGRHYKL